MHLGMLLARLHPDLYFEVGFAFRTLGFGPAEASQMGTRFQWYACKAHVVSVGGAVHRYAHITLSFGL